MGGIEQGCLDLQGMSEFAPVTKVCFLETGGANVSPIGLQCSLGNRASCRKEACRADFCGSFFNKADHSVESSEGFTKKKGLTALGTVHHTLSTGAMR